MIKIPDDLVEAAVFVIDLQDQCEARMGEDSFLDILKAARMVEDYVAQRKGTLPQKGCDTCKHGELTCGLADAEGDCNEGTFELYERA